MTGRARSLLVALGACGLLGSACGGSGVDAPDAAPIQIKILAINDFHGSIVSPGTIDTPTGPEPAGGADYLAAHLAAASLGDDSTIIVSAGDLIGGSPLISALFHDEPTIEVMNAMGLAINALGNHEFDEDVEELRRMKNGGCHPVEGCFGGDGFDGARFSFLGANAIEAATDEPLFPPYEVRTLQGIDIGFIGLTTERTPSSTTPITGVSFLDEAEAINIYVAELQALGVENIVVLVHEGGTVQAGGDCVGLSGRIVSIANALDPAVDLVLSGHTHQLYRCEVNGIPVSSAGELGTYFSDITLTIANDSKRITGVDIVNRPVLHDIAPEPAITAMVDTYRELSAPLENRIVGQITADITRTRSGAGESPLGNLVADAMLAATPGSAVAFQQNGGLRADLHVAASDGETADGQVRYGELFAVQPFQNLLVTMTLTGQQLHDLLEEGVRAGAQSFQVSATLSYTWHSAAPPGDRVEPAEVLINGAALDLGANYTITTNSFLSSGNGAHPILESGTNPQTVAVDIDALAAYIESSSPIAPPALGRITVVP